jgi:hypothetical protein
MFTVKIAAIEQQSNFRVEREDGSIIGIELGADVAANVDLDEFMVFEQNEERARTFFRGLLFKHLTLGVDEHERVEGSVRRATLSASVSPISGASTSSCVLRRASLAIRSTSPRRLHCGPVRVLSECPISALRPGRGSKQTRKRRCAAASSLSDS